MAKSRSAFLRLYFFCNSSRTNSLSGYLGDNHAGLWYVVYGAGSGGSRATTPCFHMTRDVILSLLIGPSKTFRVFENTCIRCLRCSVALNVPQCTSSYITQKCQDVYCLPSRWSLSVPALWHHSGLCHLYVTGSPPPSLSACLAALTCRPAEQRAGA